MTGCPQVEIVRSDIQKPEWHQQNAGVQEVEHSTLGKLNTIFTAEIINDFFWPQAVVIFESPLGSGWQTLPGNQPMLVRV